MKSAAPCFCDAIPVQLLCCVTGGSPASAGQPVPPVPPAPADPPVPLAPADPPVPPAPADPPVPPAPAEPPEPPAAEPPVPPAAEPPEPPAPVEPPLPPAPVVPAVPDVPPLPVLLPLLEEQAAKVVAANKTIPLAIHVAALICQSPLSTLVQFLAGKFPPANG